MATKKHEEARRKQIQSTKVVGEAKIRFFLLPFDFLLVSILFFTFSFLLLTYFCIISNSNIGKVTEDGSNVIPVKTGKSCGFFEI